jgi:hypothetical protein
MEVMADVLRRLQKFCGTVHPGVYIQDLARPGSEDGEGMFRVQRPHKLAKKQRKPGEAGHETFLGAEQPTTAIFRHAEVSCPLSAIRPVIGRIFSQTWRPTTSSMRHRLNDNLPVPRCLWKRWYASTSYVAAATGRCRPGIWCAALSYVAHAK